MHKARSMNPLVGVIASEALDFRTKGAYPLYPPPSPPTLLRYPPDVAAYHFVIEMQCCRCGDGKFPGRVLQASLVYLAIILVLQHKCGWGEVSKVW